MNPFYEILHKNWGAEAGSQPAMEGELDDDDDDVIVEVAPAPGNAPDLAEPVLPPVPIPQQVAVVAPKACMPPPPVPSKSPRVMPLPPNNLGSASSNLEPSTRDEIKARVEALKSLTTFMGIF